MSFVANIFKQLSLLGRFWQEPHNSKMFRLNLLFIGFQLLYLFLKFNDLPPQVPLYYSLAWGEGRLSSVSGLFILPTFSIIIAVINHLLAIFLVRQKNLFSYLLVSFSLVFSVLVTFSLVKVINLAT
ncbi:MAG: hypothetical protein WC686_02240 [Candidatus Shapirobacteria bacterium]|jgi:hypothetical protein